MSLLDGLTTSLVESYTKHLDVQQKRELFDAIDKLGELKKGRIFYDMFPDTGPLRRELYKAHMNFIREGKNFREKLFLAGNRTGKSIVGCYEVTAHATGDYPEWWEGRVFNKPTKIWVGGDTSISVRDILQQKLLGNPGEFGTGMIPKEYIIKTTTKRNIPDAVETIHVKHKCGGYSIITFKTYEQGRELWQGTEQDIIWMDEEPPMDVYAEAIIRTMTTNGLVMSTFTPLRGMSAVIKGFMDAQKKPTDLDKETEKLWKPAKYMTTASWDDAPHLTADSKREMLQAIPPNQRDARSKGLPTIGSGLIYPTDETTFIKNFEIPKHWSKVYGMDVGWNVTAAVFAALDRDTDTIYIYDEYYGQTSEPAVHSDAIKRRGGGWMKGVIDTAARGRSQIDGANLWDIYSKQFGLKIYPANKAVEAGIYEVWTRISSGRLKIFRSCSNLERELKMYHRDEKGKINKSDDHLLDSLRYLSMSGIPLASPHISMVPRSENKVISLASWC
jgi:phage terminase large subunit-like protein